MTEFEDKLAQVARRARDYASSLDTEEATKNALVMPFISQVLGYDVFDPQAVSYTHLTLPTICSV